MCDEMKADKLDVTITFRMTSADRDALERAADADNRKVGEYIRLATLTAMGKLS